MVFPTDVVGNHELIAAAIRQRLQKRNHLVVFDLNRSVKWSGDRHSVERPVGVGVEIREDGTPPRGADEGIEIVSRHRGVG